MMTKEQREECARTIQKMKEASQAFYLMAVKTDKHQFVEFNGLLVEYIKLMEAQFARGEDIITGDVLPLKAHNAEYIGEKLNCIFGDTFLEKPEIQGAFLTALLHGAAVTVTSHDDLVDEMSRT